MKAVRCRAALALAFVLAAVSCARGAPIRREPPARARGLYVGDIAAALANLERENELLELIRRGGFSHLVLYGLGPVFRNGRATLRLARFVARARAEAGVRSVAAPIAKANRIREVLAFGIRHPEGAFDAMVTEDEYWLRCEVRRANTSGERADCFPQFVRLLDEMRSAAATDQGSHRLRIGAYLGYPTATEARRIAGLVDYVLLNYAVPDPRRAWSHVHPYGGPLRDRLRWFADAGVEVWPIFYMQGEVDMGDWLRRHGLRAAEKAFLSDSSADIRARLGGFQFFIRDVFTTGRALRQ